MKPILFNTDMVKAILSGKKTMTRRLIKFPKGTTGRLPSNGFFNASPYLFYPGGIKHPRYKVGDVLYVRETWWKTNDRYYYLADYDLPELVKKQLSKSSKCRPSIHMPKEAARIFLKVTNVRVERLQDINGSDCVKEGCAKSYADMEDKLCDYCPLPDGSKGSHCYGGNPVMCEGACCKEAYENYLEDNAVNEFQDLWDSTIQKKDIDKYGWNANPWVFAYEFERCEKPNETEVTE